MRLIQRLFFTFLLILVWTQEAQAGSCRDPWITQVFKTSTKLDLLREPSGSGDYGECNYKLYNSGSWNSYAELEDAIVQVMKPNPYAMCRDPWITMVYLSRYNRYPAGNGDKGECDYTRYNNGSWSSFQELDDAIQKAQSTPPPVTSADLAVLVPSIDFGNVIVGATSQPQAITLRNPGTQAISLEGYSTASTPCDFTRASSDCYSMIPSGGSCSINMVFKPSKTGAQSDALTLRYGGGKTKSVALSGTGIVTTTGSPNTNGGAMVSLSDTNLNFGEQLLNNASAAKTLTITNSGTAALNFGGVLSGKMFSQTSTCTGALQPGASCAFNVIFTPATLGAVSGSLTIMSNASNGAVQTVALSGTGVDKLAPPSIAYDPILLEFSAPVYSESTEKLVKITNNGTVKVSFEKIYVRYGTHFERTYKDASWNSVPNQYCGALQPKESCYVGVTFKPKSQGSISDELVIKLVNGVSLYSVDLKGSASASVPMATLDITSMEFGTQTLNTPSEPKFATLTNTGGATLTINTLSSSKSDFGRTDASTCTPGSSLAPKKSCTIYIVFNPSKGGESIAEFSINTNDSRDAFRTQKIVLRGSGEPPIPNACTANYDLDSGVLKLPYAIYEGNLLQVSLIRDNRYKEVVFRVTDADAPPTTPSAAEACTPARVYSNFDLSVPSVNLSGYAMNGPFIFYMMKKGSDQLFVNTVAPGFVLGSGSFPTPPRDDLVPIVKPVVKKPKLDLTEKDLLIPPGSLPNNTGVGDEMGKVPAASPAGKLNISWNGLELGEKNHLIMYPATTIDPTKVFVYGNSVPNTGSYLFHPINASSGSYTVAAPSLPGKYIIALYRDSALVEAENGESSFRVGHSWNGHGTFANLDYGIYWFKSYSDGLKHQSEISTDYFDPDKNTVIYVHGWQQDATKNSFRESFLFTDAEGVREDLITHWRNDNYNVGIFYWNQFADDTSDIGSKVVPYSAEAKIWTTAGPNGDADLNRGMRYWHWDDSDGTNGKWVHNNNGLLPINKTVAELFYDDYVKAFANYKIAYDANGNPTKDFRLVGHSLGHQVVTRTAQLVAERGGAPLPTRIALLDAAATNNDHLWGKKPFTWLAGYIENLQKQGVVFEGYQTSKLMDLAWLIGSNRNEEDNVVAYTRLNPEWVHDATKKAHSEAIRWYFLSKKYNPPKAFTVQSCNIVQFCATETAHGFSASAPTEYVKKFNRYVRNNLTGKVSGGEYANWWVEQTDRVDNNNPLNIWFTSSVGDKSKDITDDAVIWQMR